tara:strand:+ start:500 stop:649 length:150 start_codon:yes stop_codon:yes gene_type:complete
MTKKYKSKIVLSDIGEESREDDHESLFLSRTLDEVETPLTLRNDDHQET